MMNYKLPFYIELHFMKLKVFSVHTPDTGKNYGLLVFRLAIFWQEIGIKLYKT